MSLDQITAEAWNKWRAKVVTNCCSEEGFREIIEATIVRAQKENFKMIATLKEELTSLAAHASEPVSECDHQWTHHSTLTYGDNPPLDIDVCVRCWVQQKAAAHASENLPTEKKEVKQAK